MNKEESITINRKEYEALITRLSHWESKKKRTFWQWILQRPAMILAISVMVGALGAGAQDIVGLYSGNTYLAQTSMFRNGYIAGVADTCRQGGEFACDRSRPGRCGKK